MNTTNTQNLQKMTLAQNISRYILGLFLTTAGISHLTWSRTEFLAQVPPWIPVNADLVVLLSGVVEIVLGLSLILLFKYRIQVGWIVAAFFVLVFPGNIAQLVEHRNAFGLNTELARWLRLPLQPLLIIVALWSTGAWHSWRKNKN
ncbi:hypothetical protein DR871_010710 [Flavobacterium petrolei]|jgi:uncharacterized membrane protein|uniref:DoxX family membrane protein n=1 Tax=Flavobacterium petrolei TaxID=2259594 RepID=A0A482TG18_9FLAO|nr:MULTISPECIES: hypothetical protein [Flavobacterium]QIH39764.1 hypothetical protein G7A72_13510 [Flavobacterium sp. Sr18]RYJ51655.1 hypothetical protein DR871_010710 [Flavobacterium petrolei]